MIGPIHSAPDDHFTAGPDCRVNASTRGRIDSSRGHPTVGSGLVSPAGVQIDPVVSAPYDHFTTSPDCRVLISGRWCVGQAGVRPTIAGTGVLHDNVLQRVDIVDPQRVD